jgi:nitrogen-specific signal transduction histidine kinase
MRRRDEQPARDHAAEVSVRDNGVGLPEPSADVFALFYSTKPLGLGMALSISRSNHRSPSRQPERRAQRGRREHLLLQAPARQRRSA